MIFKIELNNLLPALHLPDTLKFLLSPTPHLLHRRINAESGTSSLGPISLQLRLLSSSQTEELGGGQLSIFSIRISPVVPYFCLGLPRVGVLGWDGVFALSLAVRVCHWCCREGITMVSQRLNTSVMSLTRLIDLLF